MDCTLWHSTTDKKKEVFLLTEVGCDGHHLSRCLVRNSYCLERTADTSVFFKHDKCVCGVVKKTQIHHTLVEKYNIVHMTYMLRIVYVEM